eukprot:4037319-Pleurochrysis_carterae.AAC.1
MVQLGTHQGHSQTKQRSTVLLKSNAAKWLGEDVHGVVLASVIPRLDGSVGNLFADLELAAVDVLGLGVAHR